MRYSSLDTDQQFIAQVVRSYLKGFGRNINIWNYLWKVEPKRGSTDRPTFAVAMKLDRTIYRYTVEYVSGIHETYYRVYGIDNKKTWSTVNIKDIFNEGKSI